MGWPSVSEIENGSDVVAGTFNKPLGQLAERTDYLRRLLALHDRTKVVVDATFIEPPGTTGIGMPSPGQPVYRVPGSASYAKAAAINAENEWFYASSQAMAVGIAGPAGVSDSVVLYGFVDFGTAGILASDVIADSSPDSGRYYLSPKYGKLTASPGGPVIYVCDCRIGSVLNTGTGLYEKRVLSMIVNPQYRDTGESHVHRSFVVSGLPMGGYCIKGTTHYEIPNFIWPDGEAPSSSVKAPNASVYVSGHWDSSKVVTYVLKVEKQNDSSAPAWGEYKLSWTATGDSPGGDVSGVVMGIPEPGSGNKTAAIPVGTHGMTVVLKVNGPSTLPSALLGKKWTIAMPEGARGWIKVDGAGSYMLNLGMYPEMERYLPPVPDDVASLTIDEAEPRGPLFGTRMQWMVGPADASGGPWLIWYGGTVSGTSATAPFKWVSNTAKATQRDITLHVNRMRVGPTGFVTSLQVAKGSPLKITSAQTDASANQGALQIALDVDFTSEEANAEGSQVVKAIEGSTFKTGPVVERIEAGPGVTLNPPGGQGVVTVSATNAVYSGDFETIALRNAKQDVAGGIFPYTKLLKWPSPSTGNVASGFTAKFRVPDHIPYKAQGYRVIVSASVFGEAASSSAASAAFSLQNYVLADYACSLSIPSTVTQSYVGRFSSADAGVSKTIAVPFAAGYQAFDPVLVHGFPVSDVPNVGQRLHVDDLVLQNSSGDVVVYPGYFVGISIDRCDVTGGADWYEGPIGIMSLRWNLVPVPLPVPV